MGIDADACIGVDITGVYARTPVFYLLITIDLTC